MSKVFAKKTPFQNEAKIELITKGELVFPTDLFNGCQKVPKTLEFCAYVCT